MSAGRLDPTPAAGSVRLRAATFTDVLRSEWTKFRTVPATFWALLIAVVLGIGLSALISGVASHAYVSDTARIRAEWDPTSVSTSGGALAQLAIGVLAILVITSEYASREIRTSLAAVPRRWRLLGGKVVVVAGVSFVLGELTMFVAFFTGQALISGHAPTATLSQPGVLRALIGSGLYVTLIALLGVGFGTLLRSTAAAISVLVATLYVLPALAVALPASLQDTVEKYWPTQAGAQVTAVVRGVHTLSPWAGLADLALFVAFFLAAAFVLLERRDA